MSLELHGEEIARLYNLFSRAYAQRNKEEVKRTFNALYSLIFGDYLANNNALRQAKEEFRLARNFRKRSTFLETISNHEKNLHTFVKTLNDLVQVEFGQIYS